MPLLALGNAILFCAAMWFLFGLALVVFWP